MGRGAGVIIMCDMQTADEKVAKKLEMDVSTILRGPLECAHCGGRSIAAHKCQDCGSNDCHRIPPARRHVPFWCWPLALIFPPLFVIFGIYWLNLAANKPDA